MTDKNKYLEFSQADFLCDEFFQDWIFKKTEENDSFWQAWLKEHPEKKEMLEASGKLLESLRFREDWPEEDRVNASLEESLRLIGEMEASGGRTPARVVRIRRFLRVAALFVLVAGIGAFIYKYSRKESRMEIATSYGSIKNITLPDNSSIVLNANSKISYNKNWTEGKPREIWLEGEAFFNVKHLDADNKITEQERFLVHIDDMTVEVLGTSFDVRQRRGKTEVVLQSGKVKILLNDRNSSHIIMKPGQKVSIEHLTKQYTIDSTVKPDEYISWIDKKLQLTNASLNQIIQYLEDNFGCKIVLQDSVLGNRRIQGIILLDNLDDALFVISNVLNVKIEKEDNMIFFIPK